MWRLLIALLLASCATQERDGGVVEDSERARIVQVLDLPLTAAPAPADGGPASKEFRRGDTDGLVDESGIWSIRTAVSHTRLRCASYETGLQLGQGNADCSEVRWSPAAQFGTRRTHCNSATLVHTGGGQLDLSKAAFEAANCVRIVTRCDGPC